MSGFVRLPYHGPVITGSQDQDNFIRNMVTVLLAGLVVPGEPWPTTTLSPSIKSAAPVLTLAEIKLHCRIDADQTAEDPALAAFEMAARIHTQRVLRRDIDETVGENVKVAMLVLIAHWYRNRESVGSNRLAALPLSYMALLEPERDFPPGTY